MGEAKNGMLTVDNFERSVTLITQVDGSFDRIKSIREFFRSNKATLKGSNESEL